jgi:hypothetical protein
MKREFQRWFEMKLRGKHPKGRPRARWEHQARKDVAQREGRQIMGRN